MGGFLKSLKVKQRTMLKIAVLVPFYSVVQGQAFQSFISFVSRVGRFFEAFIFTSSSCYLFENRNKLVEMFSKADEKVSFDYALWVDSDIVFRVQDVVELINEIKRVGCDMGVGVYFNRVNGNLLPMVSMKKSSGEEGYETISVKELLTGKPTRIDAGGFGFVAMKASVIREMVKANESTRIFRYREKKNGSLVGEDNVFFEDAKKLGFSLYCFPKVRVGHAKTTII